MGGGCGVVGVGWGGGGGVPAGGSVRAPRARQVRGVRQARVGGSGGACVCARDCLSQHIIGGESRLNRDGLLPTTTTFHPPLAQRLTPVHLLTLIESHYLVVGGVCVYRHTGSHHCVVCVCISARHHPLIPTFHHRRTHRRQNGRRCGRVVVWCVRVVCSVCRVAGKVLQSAT